MKRVWLNIITGKFSNSWPLGGDLDMKFTNWEEEIKEASNQGWKLIEYTCVNDPSFELYNQMRLR